ncbi:MAG: protein-export chaperone SecB [Pseudomonadota bacterium]
MAEENPQNTATTQGSENASGPNFSIQKIFIKDLSFEAPDSPEVFMRDWKGETGIQLNTNARPLNEQDGVFEVELGLTVTTESEGKTAYLVEIKQAGVFVVHGFPEDQRNQLLGAYCPNVLFPFARETIADLVLKGGFPQLLLQPVNFEALYAQHRNEQQNPVAADGNGAATSGPAQA